MSRVSGGAARHERISSLFLEACELPAHARETYLRQHCRDDDADLLREVLELLAHDGAAAAIDRPLVNLPASASALASGQAAFPLAAALHHASSSAAPHPPPPPYPAPPPYLGDYEILGILGEGGMGTVYRARQQNPDRIVALKVIRPGIASRAMIKRFEMEARLLGRLQHPGIAQIHEAGTADTGHGAQPYFAMELIDGRPLIDYADERHLDARERLELIARIADAVQHAHQKGIVHRDLKPGNILVLGEPAAGLKPVCRDAIPKILDFGVARAIDPDFQSATLQTDVGQLIGTLAYMSPEQVAGDPREVDVRSDVYALGVIAYELLSGRLPHDVQGKTILEAARTIQTQPAMRLSAISRAWRGDVETIINKAMDKEKSHRYQSASDLAEDIRRYLRDEPIVARPPSAVYTFRKFARRNRTFVGGAVVALALLIVAVVGTSYGLMVARAQRDEAQRAADKATAVRQFFLEVLTSPAPQAAGRDVKVLDALRRAQGAVAEAFPDQPELRGDVHAEMAATFARLGEPAEAEAHARHALRIRTQTLGESHRDTIRSMNDLANILIGYDRVQHAGAREEADALLDRAIELLRREHADHPDALIDLLSNKAALMFGAQRLDEAERLARETLELAQAHLGETHTSAIQQRQNLAVVLGQRGLDDQAEPEFRRVVELLTQVNGPKDPVTFGAQRALAAFLRGIKRYDEAEAIYRDNLPIVTNVMGANHSETVIWHNELAFCLKKQSKYAEATDEYRAALQAARSMDGGSESYLAIGIADSLAITLSVMGEHAQAEPLYREAMLGLEKLHGPAANTTLYETCKLANALLELGRHEEALALVNDRLALAIDAAADEITDATVHAPAAQAIALLRIAAARSMHAAGRREETIALIDQCVRECVALETKGGRDHYLMPAALAALAECCDATGMSSQAATVRGWLETDRSAAADDVDSAAR